MKPGWKNPALLICAAAAVARAATGGGKLDPRALRAPNHPAVITLTQPTLESGDDARRLTVGWTARDPDGRVDHFVYAVDPARVDKVDGIWTLTHESGTVARFARGTAIGRLADAKSDERHVFVVRAVDDRGALSAPAAVATIGDDIAPIVFIDTPPPNAVFTPILPPAFDVHWRGMDPDGQVVKYKYRLFGQHNPDFPGILDFVSFVVANPQFLTNVYGPAFGPSDKCPTCTSWDS